MAESTQPRDPLTERIIGMAIEVHRSLGPGLLESAYEECMTFEATEAGLHVQRQVVIPVTYKSIRLAQAYRIDLIIENRLILEIKAVDLLHRIHQAQLLTYLKLSGIHTGLLLNFQVRVLKEGIKRMVL